MSEINQPLQSAAQMVLSVLAPKLARVVRITVRFQDDADTASTDGNVFISMPRNFAGAPIPDDAPVTLGLLAHELGHWVQPLREITEISREKGAPHWLVNIVLDVHSESFVETVFPTLRNPLRATRRTVRKAALDKYRSAFITAMEQNDIQGMVLNASLIARAVENAPWSFTDNKPPRELEGMPIPEWLGIYLRNVWGYFDATRTSPSELPSAFRNFLYWHKYLLNPPLKAEGKKNSDANSGDQNDQKGGQKNDDDAHRESDNHQTGDNSENDENASDSSAAADDETGDANSDDSRDGDGDQDDFADDADERDDANDADGNHLEDNDQKGDEDDGKSESDAGSAAGDGAGANEEDEAKGDEDDDILKTYPQSDFDNLGEMLLDKLRQNTRKYHAPPQGQLLVKDIPRLPPLSKAVSIARTLQPRFQSPHAKLEVAAPGRLDRLEMARGAPVPLRMDVQGHEAPAIKLVLALDVSGSMFNENVTSGGRITPALTAAQAVTLAVKDAGGEVVVILFNSLAYISPQTDDGLAFTSLENLKNNFRGGTSFLFLATVWRRWPQHQVLMVTDGDSSYLPDPLPQDRERTSVILIASQIDVSAFAARSMNLDKLDKLASVLAYLLPDRRL